VLRIRTRCGTDAIVPVPLTAALREKTWITVRLATVTVPVPDIAADREWLGAVDS
jgi:hypothetical protein